MKIYFTAKTSNNGENARYEQICTWITKLGHTIISGQQIFTPSLKSKDTKLSAEQIFTREKQRMDEADCIVAEVTTPSSGVGGEIVYALIHSKPVLALVYKDAENTLSPMIAGNPSDHLYIEHYEDDNGKIILKKFFQEVEVEHNRKGKLIVIDGGDGSGKATQSDLLKTYLEKQHLQVKYMDFPRYYSSFHGAVVGRFLAGDFGSLEAVSPYLASLAYALDRASAKEEMDEWLSDGGILLCNRYATSSMAHQASKLQPKEQENFIAWLDEMEYKVHKIPREDIVVYLYVPWKIGFELTQKKEDRKYLNGKLDIQEKDLQHREHAESMYLKLAHDRKNWIMINCTDASGRMKTKEEIHKEIVAALIKKNIISK